MQGRPVFTMKKRKKKRTKSAENPYRICLSLSTVWGQPFRAFRIIHLLACRGLGLFIPLPHLSLFRLSTPFRLSFRLLFISGEDDCLVEWVAPYFFNSFCGSKLFCISLFVHTVIASEFTTV